MTNFFKTNSVKDFPTSKASFSSARAHNNTNLTSLSNLPVVIQPNHEGAVSPIAKEIDYRLKVLNKILPHEQILKLSQEFIGRLESACFERIAESICVDSRVPNGHHGGASSICGSSVSHRINPQTRAMPSGMTSFLAPTGNRNATQLMFNAAKNLRMEKDDLETINEEPQVGGLTINTSKDKAKSKGKAKLPPKSAVPSSQDPDETLCFRKPLARPHSQKPKTNPKNPDSSAVKSKAKKKKLDDEADVSTGNLDLTITKTSLRSNSRAIKNANQQNTRKATSKKTEMDTSIDSQVSRYGEEDEIDVMSRIVNRPKKTALSPFFNRFSSRCSAFKITSTPFRK